MDVLPAELWGQIHGYFEWKHTPRTRLITNDLAGFPVKKEARHAISGPHTPRCSHDKQQTRRTLGLAHTLVLRHCPMITAVAEFANVNNLSLEYCANVKDVSSLFKVHSLSLYGCDKIKDFSRHACALTTSTRTTRQRCGRWHRPS